MTHNVMVVGLDDRTFNFPIEKNVQATTLKAWLSQKMGETSFHLTHNGVPLSDTDVVSCEQEYGTTLIRAHPILYGGKGGFGALIRAVGSRANRGNTKEACRDLSGRRLRDVNAQKKVSKWVEDEPERKRRKQEEKRKRLLQKKDPPKHFFNDQAYMEQLRNNEEEMDSALKQGLASSSKGLKRKQPSNDGASESKRAKFWMGGGEEEEVDISSEESSEEESEPEQLCGDIGEQPGPSGNSTRIDRDTTLNSAGSSDEAVRSKPSEDEEDGEQSTRSPPAGSSAEVMIHIPPLDKKESSDGDSEVCNPSLIQPAENGDAQIIEADSNKNGGPNLEEKSSEQEQKEVSDLKQDTLKQTPPTQDNGPLNLDDYSSAVELESVGAERLKSVLQSMGLKCGGTLQERAQRLFSTKGKSLEELDPCLFAKTAKTRKRKNK